MPHPAIERIIAIQAAEDEALRILRMVAAGYTSTPDILLQAAFKAYQRERERNYATPKA